MTEEMFRCIHGDMCIAYFLRSWCENGEYAHDNLTFEILSLKAGIAIYKMEDYFCRKIGMKPICWRNKIRIYKSVELMHRFRTAAIANIGLNVGFNDRRNFSKTFISMIGMSPSEYRQKSLHKGRLGIYFTLSR